MFIIVLQAQNSSQTSDRHLALEGIEKQGGIPVNKNIRLLNDIASQWSKFRKWQSREEFSNVSKKKGDTRRRTDSS